MLPLQHGDGGTVPTKLVRHRVLLLQDAGQHVLAVVEVFVELPAGLQHLVARIDEFEEVGPGVVERVLPLRYGGGIGVAHGDERVCNLVDRTHALRPDALCVLRKLPDKQWFTLFR